MNPRLRIPLAVLAGAVAVAAFWAVRPAGDATPIDNARAAEAATDPGALVPFLRFAGTDSVKVKPDQAEVQVTATATEKTSAAALDEASKKLESVIGRMQQLGIPDEDLSTEPAYTYQDYESKDWVANVTLKITVDDPAKAGDVLTAANAAGADSVSGPYFSVENQEGAYAEALKKAIDDARSKADAAAAQMGVTVTGIVSVDESPGAAQPPIAYAAAADAGGAAEDAARSSVPVQPGDQEIFASVTVTFSYAAPQG